MDKSLRKEIWKRKEEFSWKLPRKLRFLIKVYKCVIIIFFLGENIIYL